MVFDKQPAYGLAGAGRLLSEDVLTVREELRSCITAGPRIEQDGLSIQAMGLADDSGGLWFMVRGLKAESEYRLEGFYPDDRVYTFLKSGTAAADGSAPGMRWNPYFTLSGWPDPQGVYRLRLTEVATGRQVECTFLIHYPNRFRVLYSGVKNVTSKKAWNLLPEGVRKRIRNSIRR